MGKLMKIWSLWLAMMLTLPLIALPCSAAESGVQGHLASVDWLKKNLTRPELVLVDASPAPQHRQRHIPGAIVSTLFTFGPKDLPVEQIETHLRSWGVGPGQQIVIYDQGGTYMATRLFWDLVHHGPEPRRARAAARIPGRHRRSAQ